MVDPWKTLGIAPTDDLRRIKKAYAARVKRVHPEDDPQGFQELRLAYETALGYARWHKAQRAGLGEGQGTASLNPNAAVAVASQRASRTRHAAEPPGLGPDWAAEAAAMLITHVGRLHDDERTWVSEGEWRKLLANESLWNVDVRQRFDRLLMDVILRNEVVFPPSIWCLLEQEFHWTEQVSSLYRSFPRSSVDRVIRQLEQAPIERAEELFRDGRYREARTLLEPLALSRQSADPRAQAARRLFNRCVAPEAAERLMQIVERLRADERLWNDVAKWRELLAAEELQTEETTKVFQGRLFDFVVQRGQGLNAAIWRLLNATYHWSTVLPEGEFVRAIELHSPAMVEDIENLCEQGLYGDVITSWANVIPHLKGDPGARCRLVLERCCIAVVERAERLEIRGRYHEAILEAAPVAQLDGEPAQKARLVLACCHLETGSPDTAEKYVRQLLRNDPTHIPGHMLLAAAYRGRGELDHARYTYEEILRLEPDNKHAQQELREVRRQLGREAPHPPAPDHWQAPGPRQGQVHESSAPDVENPARLGPYSAWPFLLLVVLNGAGISIDSWFLLLTAVLMIGVVVGGWLFWRQGKERPIALGLHEAEPPPAPKSTRFRGFTYLAILFGAIGVLLLVVWWGS